MSPSSPVVIVTGAAGNLGRAVLTELASRGDSLVAVDREVAPLADALAATAHPQDHLALPGVDLGDPLACGAAVTTALDRFGRLDGLVHTVGGFAAAPAADSGPALWQQMFALNVLTAVSMIGACLPVMRRAGGGSIVLIGAGAALRAPSGLAAYAAAKSALLRLVESYADELKKEGVRINAVLPTIIDTPQNRAAMPDADHAAWVRPQELATAIAFLLGPSSSGITGAALPIAGRV